MFWQHPVRNTFYIFMFTQTGLVASRDTTAQVDSISGAAQFASAPNPTMPFKRIRIATDQDINRSYPVLAAIIENPELALSVEELVVDALVWPRRRYCSFGEPEEVQPMSVNLTTHARLQEYVRSISLDKAITQQMLDALAWKIAGGAAPTTESGPGPDTFASTVTVLLLSLCKNISVFHAYFEWHRIIAEFLLKNNYNLLPQPALQQLKHVRIATVKPEDEREYDRAELLEHFRFFGRLPAMEFLEEVGVMEYQMEREIAPPGTSNIRKLHLIHVDIGSTTVAFMIRSPKNLEEFKLSLGGLSCHDGASAAVVPKTLGKALLEHKAALKSLDMDLESALSFIPSDYEKEDARDPDEYDEDEDEDEDEEHYAIDSYYRLDEAIGNQRPLWTEHLPNTREYGYTIGSLHDFESMAHLAITISALLGPSSHPAPFRLVDALPPSLTSLHLYGYTRGHSGVYDEHVDELLKQRAERFPLLVELRGVEEPIILGVKTWDRGGSEKEMAEVRESFTLDLAELDWEEV
ncbi:hypothetical protein B0T25DRAFT_537501 [Lasiosphaeria hispida]|uniref:Uncharacterized protein n=1 Tax=Lasiosphaeria hispida TaxID=260671 RepID=A0AAJ0MFJ8_9PEZI|nr:hypothetical protein B0T25DRAFT_537501 [Lasiosphaeria hispida]